MFLFNNIDLGKLISRILLEDSVTDVMIWDKDIWVSDISKGHYRIDLQSQIKQEVDELLELLPKIPRQIALRMECKYNDANPFIDGEGLFEDLGQLRFNCIHENVTNSQYPAIAIRKSIHSLRINQQYLLDSQYSDETFFDLMEVLVSAGCNIMISGNTGSGKTELLRYLVRFIPQNEAIITIEDTYEAYIKDIYPNKNVLSLKSSEYTSSGDLLKPCLRQNPDWICISEARGKEVIYLLEALSTGHHMISTLHSDSAVNIPLRILEMSEMNQQNSGMFLKRIYANLDIGIHISYFNDEYGAHRRINEIVEYFLDDQLKEKVNIIYNYDFQNGKGTYFPLKSDRIKRKTAERHLNFGSFLKEQKDEINNGN